MRRQAASALGTRQRYNMTRARAAMAAHAASCRLKLGVSARRFAAPGDEGMLRPSQPRGSTN